MNKIIKSIKEWKRVWGIFVPYGAEQDLIERIEELKEEKEQ